ncbi:MAG TPA: hypothetical protein VGC92_00955 [Phenylobacterium sp.]
MRRSIAIIAAAAALALAGLATPALADTLQEIIAHGMVVTIADMDIDIAFTPDGKFTGFGGQLTGTWKIDGDKLCTTSNLAPDENCTAYPSGKKSGDTFEVSNELGTAKVHIR